MPPNNYRRRRVRHGPSKNELRAKRNEKAVAEEARIGALRQRFPTLSRILLDLRMEGATGIPMGQDSKIVGLDEPFNALFPCPSSCGNGQFDLMIALDSALTMEKDSQEGMEICQAASYMDPRTLCGTKLYYRFTFEYQTQE
jgi:hypothetical protein